MEPPPDRITLCTWNIWFDRFQRPRRHASLFEELRRADADVIALQEMTSSSLSHLREQPWVRDYQVLDDDLGAFPDSYGVVILSRLPILRHELVSMPSEMDRNLLVADLGYLAVATVHLESMRDYAASRAEQLRVSFDHLERHDSIALMGDFNFCSSWAENDHVDPGYLDVWPSLHPEDPGYTENTHSNIMRWKAKGKHKAVRFDRVLLRAATGAWRPRSIELMGSQCVDAAHPEVFPSDHYGLRTVFAAVP